MGKKFKKLPRVQKATAKDPVMGFAKMGDQVFILHGTKWTNRIEVKVS